MIKPAVLLLVLASMWMASSAMSADSEMGVTCIPAAAITAVPSPEVIASLQKVAAAMLKQRAAAAAAITASAGGCPARRVAGALSQKKAATSLSCGGCSAADVAKLKKMVGKLLNRQKKLNAAIKKEKAKKKKVVKKKSKFTVVGPRPHRASLATPAFHTKKVKLPVVYNQAPSRLSERVVRMHRRQIMAATTVMGESRHRWTIQQPHFEESKPIMDKVDVLSKRLKELQGKRYVEAHGVI